MPSCSGWAWGVLSTFAISAGRARMAASGWGRPVRGDAGAAVVEVVVGRVVDVVDVVTATGVFDPPPANASVAISTTTTAMPTPTRIFWLRESARRRSRSEAIGLLELPERGDALLEWGVGVEQAVQPGRIAAT